MFTSTVNSSINSFEPLHGITSSVEYSAHEGRDRPMYANRSVELLDRAFQCHFDGIPSFSTGFAALKLDPFFKG